jgi:hypothetical protein
MRDFGVVFQKLDTRHKPASQSPHLDDWTDSNSKRRTKSRNYELHLLIVVLAVSAVIAVVLFNLLDAIR